MDRLTLVCAGLAGGALGGMGMGGGTLLIPLLTLLCGFSQHAAQAVNLVVFIPMSAVSLLVHAKNGLLRTSYFFTVALPAAGASVAASFLAMNADGELLGRIFGGFLVAAGAFGAVAALTKKKERMPVSIKKLRRPE